MDPQIQNQTPVTPEAPVKHHNFIYILVGLFILLVLAGIFALKYRSESQVQIPCVDVVTSARNPETGEVKTFGTPCEVPKGWVEVSEPVVDETATWKTYRNEEYGFEFKYPQNWRYIVDDGIYFKSEEYTPPSDYPDVLSVHTYSSFIELKNKYYIKENDLKSFKENADQIGKPTIKTFNNISWICSMGDGPGDIESCSAESKNSLVSLNFSMINTEEILSTFKFVNSTSTTNTTSTTTTSQINAGVLVRIYNHGGLCARMEDCLVTTTIWHDGAVSFQNGRNKFKINNTDLNNLINLVNSANYKVMRESKFTDTCPVAYDGQQTEYTFYTNKGEEVIDSCKVNINYNWELFKAITNILNKYIPYE